MNTAKKQARGVVGSVRIHNRPVIYALVPELPADDIQRTLRYLTVVAWKYDGDQNNGMPAAHVNEQMLALESALGPLFDASPMSVHAYNRTGDNLKEFAFYVADPSEFIARLNAALADLSRFPIDISYFDDPEWSDFRDIASLFADTSGTDAWQSDGADRDG